MWETVTCLTKQSSICVLWAAAPSSSAVKPGLSPHVPLPVTVCCPDHVVFPTAFLLPLDFSTSHYFVLSLISVPKSPLGACRTGALILLGFVLIFVQGCLLFSRDCQENLAIVCSGWSSICCQPIVTCIQQDVPNPQGISHCPWGMCLATQRQMPDRGAMQGYLLAPANIQAHVSALNLCSLSF